MVQPLIIFDLDETLFHTEAQRKAQRDTSLKPEGRSAKQRQQPYSDQLCRVVFEDNYYIYEGRLRPGARELVRDVRQLGAQTAIWTSSTEDYARFFIDSFFPDWHRQYLFCWTRQHCELRRSWRHPQLNYVKDLNKVTRAWNVPLRQILMVDDSPEKLQSHKDHLLQVTPWLGNPYDDQLNRLGAFLFAMSLQSFEPRRLVRQWQRHGSSKDWPQH